jgi:acyl carrier protein
MKKDEITQKVFDSVLRLSNVTSIEAPNTFEEIGITSLKFIRLVIDLEKKCEMRFNDTDIDLKLFYKIDDIINYINAMKNDK